MKVLYVSTWFPYPLDAGSRIRVHYLLQAVARQHDVHLLSFVPRAEDLVCVPILQSWGVSVSTVLRDPFWRDPRGSVLGYLSIRPRDAIACHSLEMARLVRADADKRPADAVVAFQINVAPYALQVDARVRILDADNYMSRWMKEQANAQARFGPRIARTLTWLKTLRYEHALMPRFDACALAAEGDRRAVQAALPKVAGRMHTIPNGVDLDQNRPGLAKPESDTLVFNGSLTYHANLEAMRWFAVEVWPLVRRERPAARLQITGRSDGADLGWLPGEGSISLTGYLEDVRPAVAGSLACVVPIRSGGGTRLKILEAMALGTPVISTSKGAEGLEVTPEHDILMADSPAAFAAQTLRLLSDSNLRDRLAADGRRLVEQKYGWDAIGRRFVELIESTAAERGKAGC